MTSKTLTISCPINLLQFLDENPRLSPSKIFQHAIENLQESIKDNPRLIEALKIIQNKDKVIKNLQEWLQEAHNEIEKLKKSTSM